MWMTIYNALQDGERPEADAPPAHCLHPSDCLRLPAKEPRSFGRASTARTLLLGRYRRLISQQCACNGDHQVDAKI